MTVSSHRVLCVDDEPGLAALVATHLERDDGIDYEAVAETDPESALDRLEVEPFDCVVSDYDMPGYTGIELLSAARESRPSLPFLLFSARDPDAIAAEMIRAGVSDYVRKRGGADGYTALLRRVGRAVDRDGGRFESGSDGISPADSGLEGDVALDRVCTVSPDGTFEFVGDEYGALYGYEPDELVGEQWQRIHPDAEVEHIRTHILPAVEEGERWTGTSTGLRADGTTFAESKMVTTTSDDRIVIAVSPFDEVVGGSPASD